MADYLEGGRPPGPRKTPEETIPENVCPIHRCIVSEGESCLDCWSDMMLRSLQSNRPYPQDC